jgi:hypothetical protein
MPKPTTADPQGGPQQGAVSAEEQGRLEAAQAELDAARARHDEHERAQQAQRPATVPVKFNGREIHVSPEAAEVWEAREREFQQKFSENSNELGQLRQWRQQVQQTVQPAQSQGPDLNTIWFTDPQKAAQMVEERTTQKLAAAYQRDLTVRNFWDTYHRKYPDYADAGVLSDAMFRQHAQELDRLPSLDAAADKLGEYVGKEILKLTRKVKTDEPTRPARLAERATGDRLPQPTPEDEEEQRLPKTLGEAIRMRQREKTTRGRRSA